MNCMKQQKEHLFYCKKCDILESVDNKKFLPLLTTKRSFAVILYEYADCENQTESICHSEAKYILGMDYAMEGMAVLSDGTR